MFDHPNGSDGCRASIWRRIWNKKHTSVDLPLHKLDGFDLLNVEQFNALTQPFIKWMEPIVGKDVLEVGCGSGAFLKNIGTPRTFSGIDYSQFAIDRIRKEIDGTFAVAEANCLPFAASHFDIVFSFGVFFYFDSLQYAQKCLLEQLRVLRPGGSIFVFEVNDEDKKALYRQIRSDEPRSRIQQTHLKADHLFYTKDFFYQFAQRHNLRCEIRDESEMGISFHSGASYRYAVKIS